MSEVLTELASSEVPAEAATTEEVVVVEEAPAVEAEATPEATAE